MKKALSIVLSICMLLSITAGLDLTALADTSSDYLYTVLDDGTAEITGYTGSDTELTIPSSIDGYSVTSIGYRAFASCDSITTVTIPDGVKNIGYAVFYCCTSLISVTIPDSVTSIDYAVFSCCSSLISVTLPSGVENVYGGTFENCTSLTSVTIPYGVESIGGNAFENCISLKSVTIPDSVMSIGGEAFSNCRNLTSLTIGNGVTNIDYAAFNNCSKLTSLTMGNSVTSIDNYAFNGCDSLNYVYYGGSKEDWNNIYISYGNENLTDATIYYSISTSVDYTYSVNDNEAIIISYIGSDSDITIPDTLDGYPVTSIEEYAFHSCENLTSITIPDSVTSISNWTFAHCTSLASITLPKSVTSIGEYAFYNCPKLTNIYYAGTEDEWNNISISDEGNNDALSNATITYVEPEHIHSYESVLTKATLKKNGNVSQVCSECGDKIVTKTIYYPKTIKLSTTSYTYNGKAKKPSVTVKDSKGKTLKAGTDYTVTYASGRKNIGKYKVTVKFKGNYSETKTLYFTINPKITLSKSSFVYNGKAQKPKVTIKDANGKAIAKKNYTISYSKGLKNVGVYKVTIKFKNGHSGTYTKEYKIVPKATSISSVTAQSKGFTVKWKKQTTQTTGYEIQYATDSKFTKNKKTVTVSKNSTTSKKITKLTAKKKYYVRVRTYKTVKVNGKSTKLYSSWTKAKTVTTKK